MGFIVIVNFKHFSSIFLPIAALKILRKFDSLMWVSIISGIFSRWTSINFYRIVLEDGRTKNNRVKNKIAQRWY